MIKNIVGIGVILLILYLTGILKKLPIIRDLPFIGDVELTDNCARKNCRGKYYLSISFDKSDNLNFEKQKMELYYSIEINNENCNIFGEGYKSGEQIIDTVTNETKSRDYPENRFIVVVSGQISDDSLFLDLSNKTKSNTDHKISVRFPFSEKSIHTLRGVFSEDLTNARGKAKIIKN